MEYVLDHWLPIVLAMSLAAMASLSVSLRGGDKRWLAIALGCAATAACVYLLASALPTPNQLVRRQLDCVVSAFKDGDEAKVLDAFSQDYSDGTRDKDAMERLVRQHMSKARLRDVWLTSVSIGKAPSDRRRARFVAHVTGNYQGRATGPDSYPIRLEVDFALSGEDWKIVSVRRFDLIRSALEIPLDRIP